MTVANGLTFRLFIGCLVTSELRAALNRSPKWKELQILDSNHSKGLQMVPFEDKLYLGKYLSSAILYLDALPTLEKEILQHIEELSPGFRQEKLFLRIFTQAFIH